MGKTSRNYVDCLVFRRRECSNFLWVSRQLNPQIAYKISTKTRPTPTTHKQAVVHSRKIQELLQELSQTQGVSKDVLEQQVLDILDEIGYNKNLKLIRWLGLVLTKIYLKVNSGIFVNVESVLRVKSKMGNCPVIFVPSHRSYGDFILISYICFTYDIEIPAIAAGMDFHSMWGMGKMLRDTGAFFMRRSYNDDSLYWTTFKQYVYQLVTKSDLGIEFFIEGTRSRSGKSLTPKYGLISMILKALFLREVPDILFVPINISYDRVLEESLFAYEMLGVPKPKETTSGFFKSLKIVKEKYGNIFFHLDEPISAKDFFGDQLNSTGHNLQPLHQQEINEYERSLIPPLAHEIVFRQQANTVTTVFNLISTVLNHNLSCGNPLLSLDELLNEVKWFKGVMEQFGAFVHMDDLRKNLEQSFEVHGNLIGLDDNRRVVLVQNSVVLDNLNPAKFKAHALSDSTMTLTIPFVMLQIYINPILHYLVDPALVVFVLEQQQLKKSELLEHYKFLRNIFSLEFVTYPTKTERDFELALNYTSSLSVVALNLETYSLGTNTKLFKILKATFQPFFTSYHTVCCVLQNFSGLVDEKTILQCVQKALETAINEGRCFVHPYCLNLETLTTCLSFLVADGTLKKMRSNGKVVYEVNKTSLWDLTERLGQYVSTSHINKIPDVVTQHTIIQNKL